MGQEAVDRTDQENANQALTFSLNSAFLSIMNIDSILIIVFAICLSILGGAWVGFNLASFKQTGSTSPQSGPRVVVNVPADWKPLETLPPSQLEGARAQLWYTVYQAAIDEGSFTYAADDADRAVETVFGPVK